MPPVRSLFLVLLISVCFGTATASSYIAAAVHRRAGTPPPGANATAVQMANLDVLEQYASTAALNHSAQIVVFPEFALGGDYTAREGLRAYAMHVPAAADAPGAIAPCDDPEAHPVLQRVSCMARALNITLVFNTVDNNGTQNGEQQFNTEVALNTRGQVIAKYHKAHPWFTKVFDTPAAVEHVSFFTDNIPGVKFGLFVCFDIAFASPAAELAQAGVKHFPYSLSVDVLGSADLLVKGWSWLHGATVLASNNGEASQLAAMYAAGAKVDPQTVVDFAHDKGALTVARVQA